MSKTASLITPAAASDRFTEIDALRGFALFGILFANIPNWVGIPFAQFDQIPSLMGSISFPALSIIFNGVLDGKFYTIFSLLFGLGFSLQLERLEAKGADGRAIFLRRMAVLFVIGIIHLSFVWNGDILTLYAVLGFTLPLFRKLTDRALLAVAGTLIFVIPFLGVWLINMRYPDWTNGFNLLGDRLWILAGGDADYDYWDHLKNGGITELPQRAASEWAYYLAGKLESWRPAKVLGTMLVGMWAGRKLVCGQLIGNSKLLGRVVIIGFAIGLPTLAVYIQQPPHNQTHWSSLLGTAPTGFAYAAGFLLLVAKLPALSALLAPVGRMALTNYLATSVVMGALFYGLGFGLMGELALDTSWLIGLGFYALMIAWSHWWLGRYKQGPMEALWRRLTYPRKPQETATAAA